MKRCSFFQHSPLKPLLNENPSYKQWPKALALITTQETKNHPGKRKETAAAKRNNPVAIIEVPEVLITLPVSLFKPCCFNFSRENINVPVY